MAKQHQPNFARVLVASFPPARAQANSAFGASSASEFFFCFSGMFISCAVFGVIAAMEAIMVVKQIICSGKPCFTIVPLTISELGRITCQFKFLLPCLPNHPGAQVRTNFPYCPPMTTRFTLVLVSNFNIPANSLFY